MGVLNCNRKDCEKIMCDIYIPEIGYICHACKHEFIEYLESKGITSAFEGDIKYELEIFMNTSKDKFQKGNDIIIEDFFKKHER